MKEPCKEAVRAQTFESILKCGNWSCEHYDFLKKRHCSNWSPNTKCGFVDVGSAVRPPARVWRPVADVAGYTEMLIENPDMVNQPPHYEFSENLEVIDVIKIAIEKNFNGRDSIGVPAFLYSQVLKYLLRCGCKDSLEEDLKKAEFYLKDLIKEVESDI